MTVSITTERNLLGTLTLFTMNNIKPNYSELERQYGVNRKTIRKYHDNGGKPIRKASKRNYQLEPFNEQIKEKMAHPGVTYQAAYQFFKAKYPTDPAFNSSSTFRWYARTVLNLRKTPKGSSAHVRYETPPGKQLQVDWKENIVMISKHGEVFKFHLLTSTWGFSRLHLWSYSLTKTSDDFIRCLIDIFNQSGGLPEEVLTDNMSAVVSIVDGRRRKHPRILQLEKDLGIKIRLAKVRSTQTKGKEKSSNRFVNWLFAYNGEFESEEELLAIIQDVSRRVNDQLNQTTQIPPVTLFRNEKETLRPLPNKMLLESFLSHEVTQVVPSTSLIRFQGSEYSVPVHLINQRVRLTESDSKLYIYHNTKLVVTHSISQKRFNYAYDHYHSALQSSFKNSVTDEQLTKRVKENLELLDKISKKGFNHD